VYPVSELGFLQKKEKGGRRWRRHRKGEVTGRCECPQCHGGTTCRGKRDIPDRDVEGAVFNVDEASSRRSGYVIIAGVTADHTSVA